MARLGRNDPCHCGSGKKYKHCHLDRDAGDGGNVTALPDLRAMERPLAMPPGQWGASREAGMATSTQPRN